MRHGTSVSDNTPHITAKNASRSSAPGRMGCDENGRRAATVECAMVVTLTVTGTELAFVNVCKDGETLQVASDGAPAQINVTVSRVCVDGVSMRL